VRPPPPPDHIDLRCGRIEDVLGSWPAGVVADLVVADPPWHYTTTLRDVYGDLNVEERARGQASIPRYTTGSPSDYFATVSTPDLHALVASVSPLARRLALWITWPILPEWSRLGEPGGWRLVTGGAWVKSDADNGGHYGPGHHWAGCSEPVLVYVSAPAHTSRQSPLRNAHVSPPGAHSAKPVEWQAAWLRRWVPEGGLVLDLYAGLGSVACATLEAGGGRRYLGAEIDPERHERALANIRATSRGGGE
jgi:hypothetical protein